MRADMHTKTLGHLVLSALVAAMVFWVIPAKAQAATHYVSTTDSIQAAIDGANNLDTIELLAGTHNLSAEIVINGKDLTVIGDETPGATIVQANGNRGFSITNATVVMENLTITGGDLTDDDGAGIYQNGGSLTLKNCVITQNGSVNTYWGGGVAVLNGKLMVTGCTISENSSYGASGIYCESSTLEIEDSNIHSNVCLETNEANYNTICPIMAPYFIGIGGGVTATYSDVIIRNTNINGNIASYGGGLAAQGSSLSITGTNITGNDGNCMGGGVVLEWSSATFHSSDISLNESRAEDTGLGGGLLVLDGIDLDLVESSISGNLSQLDGGGIYLYDSLCTLSSSTISDNKAGDGSPAWGGGLALDDYTSINISDSTISGNTATASGGGIWMYDADVPASGSILGKLLESREIGSESIQYTRSEPLVDGDLSFVMNNSTVSGNSALDSGGGLAIADMYAFINFSTITGNTANHGGGIFNDITSTVYFGSNIVAGNTGVSGGPDWYSDGALVSRGGNLVGINTDSGLTDGFPAPNSDGDYVGTSASPIDPQLGPLAENGGPTKTHALTSQTNPAVNKALTCVDRDQRGYDRPYPESGACDIGAFEFFGVADLTLSKIVDNASPLVDDWITYTLTITNNGPDQASGVTVTDLLPTGLSHVSDDSGGSYDPTTGLWSIGTLNVSDTLQLNIEAQVDQAGTITNSATAGAFTSDPTPASDSAVINATNRTGATLTLTKTVDDATPKVDDEIEYTLTVSNLGPDPAEDVLVSDLLPTGLTWESDDSGGDYNSVTGIWTIGDLGVSETKVLKITVKVDRSGIITNTATAFSSTAGTNTPTARVNIQATEAHDVTLTLSKTVNNAVPLVGNQVTYTLTVTNQGPDVAENVRVTDLLPTGVSWESDDSGGDYDSGTGVWTVGDLSATDTEQLKITVEVEQAGTITNTAAAFSSTIGANSPTAGVDIEATEVHTVALTLTKTVNNATPLVGDQVTYTLTVTNQGPDVAENVRVTDLLPTGLTWESDDSGGNYDSGTGVWTVGDLSASESGQLTITVEVGQAGTITNTATAFSTTIGANSPTAGVDIEATDVQTVALTLTKTVNNASLLVGDQVTYTLTVTNQGPDVAEDVRVTDLLPTGVSWISDDSGGDYDSGTGVWTVGDLSAGGSEQLAITVEVTRSGTITNTAAAFSSTVGANSPTAGVDIEATEVYTVTMSLAKTVNNATPLVGDQVTYTLTVTNQGPDVAEDVRVSDLLPTGVSWISDDSGGDYDSGTGVWTVGDLSAGGSEQLAITVEVTRSGTITNTAAAFSSTVGANSPTAGVDIAATEVHTVALTLTKTVNNATPLVGDQVTYTLTVTNQGPDAGENVKVSDLLPTGLTWVSDDSVGAYDSGTGLWTIGDLAVSGTRQLNLTVEVAQAGIITNTAAAFSSTVGANSPTAGVDIAATDVQTVALTLTKTVNNATPLVGDQVVYTLTLANQGPDAAENVRVGDLLPTGLSWVSDDSGGDYVSGTGLWTVGDLPASGTRQLNLTVEVAQAGIITNTAAAFSTTVGANSPTAGVDIEATDVQTVALTLTKTVNNATPLVGDQVTYTLTVTNQGPDAAEDVRVTDLLPTGVAWVSDDSGGDYVSGTGLWTIGNLSPSGTRQLNITVEVAQTGIITNTAAAFSSTIGANSPTAGVDIQATSGQGATLALTKTVDKAAPFIGDQIVYTLTVINLGPEQSAGTRVTDLLPLGLDYISDSSGGNYDVDTGVWAIGDLAVSGTRQLTITAQVTQAGTITNTATAESDTPGSTPAIASEDIEARTQPTVSLDLTKTVDNLTPEVGAQVIYTLTVTNQGSDNAEDVTIMDLLPSGITYVSDDSADDFDPDKGEWIVGDLEESGTAQLNITVKVERAGIITNTATAFSSLPGSVPATASVYIAAWTSSGGGGGGGGFGCFIQSLW